MKIISDTERAAVDIRKFISLIFITSRTQALQPELRQKLDDLGKVLDPTNSSHTELSKRPRCWEETRREYLVPAMEFIFSEDPTRNILWLSGAAGSGKTTISVTLSDACEEYCRSIQVFFERGKSDPSYVIRTIANKLACLHNSVAKYILRAFEQNRNITNSTLDKQFEKLLLEPLRSCARDIVDPIVVFLDALDECGTIEQRRELLHLLKTHFTMLPPKFRFVITSRPINDIVQNLSSDDHILHMELDHKSDVARSDVAAYVKREMRDALGKESVKVQALDEKLQALAHTADGLFVWASTAVRMVINSDNCRQVFEKLVDDPRSIDVDGIDSLYTTVLEESGISWHYTASREQFTSILGTVLLAKEAMTSGVIEAFLGLDADAADRTLSRLKAVLSYENGQPVRLHHASFADYLLSIERSGSHPWHIDESEQKQAVTERCFEVMGKLSFNICCMESSFTRNKDVSDLSRRVANHVPAHLEYSCIFWSAHLMESNKPKRLLEKLRRFGNEHLLYWFEVLSLTGQFGHIAVRALYHTSTYVAVCPFVSLPLILLSAYIFFLPAN